MRRYLLDAGPLAALLLNRPPAVALMRPWLISREAATSKLVYGEVFEYIRPRTDFPDRQIGLRQLLRGVPPFMLSYRIMERYASLRLQMRKPYGPGLIGDIDTLIAATALERGLTVVTTDGDYLRVPDLPVLLLDRYTLEEHPHASP